MVMLTAGGRAGWLVGRLREYLDPEPDLRLSLTFTVSGDVKRGVTWSDRRIPPVNNSWWHHRRHEERGGTSGNYLGFRESYGRG